MKNTTKIIMDATFKSLLEAEGSCPRNNKAPHKWNDMIWLPQNRAWFRKCQLCGAIEVWRGNDTIYYSTYVYKLIVFHHKHEFTENNEAAIKFLCEARREAEDY